MRPMVKDEINKLLEADIIEKTDSTYASPIVMVKKADNAWRFCADYKKLN